MPIASLLLVGVSLAFVGLGVRLWRNGHAGSPERVLAIAFGTLGLSILPRFTAAQMLSGGADLGRGFEIFNGLTHGFVVVGIIGIGFFLRRVFRPEGPLGRILVGTITVTNVASTLALALFPSAQQETSAVAVLANVTRVTPFLWGFVECVLYGRQLDRQAALGIAIDPVVRNRFRLWAVWTGALGFGPWFVIAIRLYAMSLAAEGMAIREVAPWTFPAAALILGAACLASSVSLWLAFFPPDWYRARIGADATSDAA